MINTWSYSRLSGWVQCPARLKFKVVDKLPDPAGPAAARGVHWHKVAEDFVGNPAMLLPEQQPKDPHMDLFREKLEALRLIPGIKLEYQVAFDTFWRPTEFMAKDAWGRMVYDVQYFDALSETVVTIDYKTGKPSASHANQLDLYAATGFLLHPTAKFSKSENWYFDLGPGATLERRMTKAVHVHVLERWKNLATQMAMDTTFAAKPGQHCRWCAFSKLKGGPCLSA